MLLCLLQRMREVEQTSVTLKSSPVTDMDVVPCAICVLVVLTTVQN
jgi:hypothetical protein